MTIKWPSLKFPPINLWNVPRQKEVTMNAKANIDVTDQLPEELLKELSQRTGPFSKTVEAQDMIIDILSQGPSLSKDELLIAVWHETKIVMKRTKLSTLLNQMVKQGDIRRVGYGVYTLTDQED